MSSPARLHGLDRKRRDLERISVKVAQVVFVHVVDPNRERAGAIARSLCARSFCVERHNGLSAFLSRPRRGVVLLSDDLDGPDPIKVLEAIDDRIGYLPAAFFSSGLAARRALRAMVAGAVDYLAWPCDAAELGETVVRLIVQGDRRAAVETLKGQARELVERLSEGERDVLRGLVAGASDTDMARGLGMSPRTVEVHRAQVMSSLDAHSPSDAVRIGIYAELDEGEDVAGRSADILPASFGRPTLVG